MAVFYDTGAQMKRPGVYMRFVNIGNTEDTVNVVQPIPPSSGDDSGSDEPVVVGRLTVSPDGVLSASGHVFSIGSGNEVDGYTVVFDAAIDAVVIGDTIVVTNPPS